MFRNKPPLSFQEILSRLMRYCSYQERSPYEVKLKLAEYRLPEDKQEELLELLEADNFISEERFAEQFVKGKVNIKRWGKYKIKEGLYAKGVSDPIMSAALERISHRQYVENLDYLLERKIQSKPVVLDEVSKLYRYLLSKGYESDLIMKKLRDKKLMS